MAVEAPVTPIRRDIDGKFSTTSAGDIIKRSNGEVLPADEPLILMRARDKFALLTLMYYRKTSVDGGCNDWHLESLDKTINRFRQFAAEHPDRMKEPSITKGK